MCKTDLSVGLKETWFLRLVLNIREPVVKKSRNVTTICDFWERILVCQCWCCMVLYCIVQLMSEDVHKQHTPIKSSLGQYLPWYAVSYASWLKGVLFKISGRGNQGNCTWFQKHFACTSESFCLKCPVSLETVYQAKTCLSEKGFRIPRSNFHFMGCFTMGVYFSGPQ